MSSVSERFMRTIVPRRPSSSMCGLQNSQTVSPCGVTSKARPAPESAAAEFCRTFQASNSARARGVAGR